MKIISFIKRSIVDNFNRFPTLTIIVIFATLVAFQLIGLTNRANRSDYDYMINQLGLVLFLCNFCFALGLALDLLCEAHLSWRRWRWLMRVLNIVLGIILFIFINLNYQTNIVRLAVLCIAAHFAVSSLPFIMQRSWTRFWNFNKELFLNIQLSIFYSGVIFVGLMIAYVAQRELLHLFTDYIFIAYLAAFVLIAFNSLFFLLGVPRLDMEETEEETWVYPGGLKVFAGFVLLPLVAIYMLILLSFELKILLTNDMPEGFVSWMIFCFAVVGILAFLLLYPIIGLKENKWIKTAISVYSISLLPLLILLWWAIIIRLKEYGWTEMRYIHFALSLWLTFFVVYFLIKRERVRIKWLPLSLVIIGLLTSFGPWGYSSVSSRHQQNLVHQIVQSTDSLSKGQLRDKIYYLTHYHGYSAVKDFVTDNGRNIIEQKISDKVTRYGRYNYELYEDVMDNLAFEIPEWTNNYNAAYQYYQLHLGGTVLTEGYKYVHFSNHEYNKINYTNKDLSYEFNDNNTLLKVTYKGETNEVNIPQHLLQYKDFVMTLKNKSYNDFVDYDTNKEALTLVLDNGVKAILYDLEFNASHDFSEINIWNTRILFLFN